MKVVRRPQRFDDEFKNIGDFESKEWGVNDSTAGSRNLSMAHILLKPGGKIQPHVHEDYESALFVIRGRVRQIYGTQGGFFDVGPGDFVYIPPGKVHAVENLGDTEPAEVIVARNAPHEKIIALPSTAP